MAAHAPWAQPRGAPRGDPGSHRIAARRFDRKAARGPRPGWARRREGLRRLARVSADASGAISLDRHPRQREREAAALRDRPRARRALVQHGRRVPRRPGHPAEREARGRPRGYPLRSPGQRPREGGEVEERDPPRGSVEALDCGDAVCLATYDAPVWIAQEAPRPQSLEWEGADSNPFDAHAAMMQAGGYDPLNPGGYDPFNPMGGA